MVENLAQPYSRGEIRMPNPFLLRIRSFGAVYFSAREDVLLHLSTTTLPDNDTT